MGRPPRHLLVSHSDHAGYVGQRVFFSTLPPTSKSESSFVMKMKYLSSVAFALLFAASAPAALLLDEPFSYADGSVITNSSFLWNTHSGTTGQTRVVSGQVNLSQGQSEDINALIPGQPYTNGFLYVSAVVSFSTLPLGSGGYFLHLKDSG